MDTKYSTELIYRKYICKVAQRGSAGHSPYYTRVWKRTENSAFHLIIVCRDSVEVTGYSIVLSRGWVIYTFAICIKSGTKAFILPRPILALFSTPGLHSTCRKIFTLYIFHLPVYLIVCKHKRTQIGCTARPGQIWRQFTWRRPSPLLNL